MSDATTPMTPPPSEPGPGARPRPPASSGPNARRPDAALVESPGLAMLLEVARQRIEAHVRQRRGRGASIERVIPELRCLVREAQSCEEWDDPDDVLMAVVAGWAVDAYVGRPARPHVVHGD